MRVFKRYLAQKTISNSHSSELARNILKDPNLTASVLKLANSAQFNATGQSIKTISRSIMVLGHKSIKEVCASCMLMEQFVKQGSSDKIQPLIARAFHAATQSKGIAMLSGQKATEEIFISALLMNLGEIAVYSATNIDDPLAISLQNYYPIAGGKERDLIGCYFSDLTLGLCSAWNIAPMIGELLGGNYAEKSPVRSVLLGNSFASSCEMVGIKPSLEKHLKAISLYTGKPPEQISENIVQATEETQKSLTKFGIKLDVKLPQKNVEIKEHKVSVDKTAQLDIVQELSVLSMQKIDVNVIFPLLLEGIQRGGGFNCALVAILNQNKKRISAKHSVDSGQSHTKENFNFDVYQEIPEIHQKVLTNRKVIIQDDLRPGGMTIKKIMRRTGVKNAVWGPLIVENQVIGSIYADNGLNGVPISQEQKECFELFVSQSKADFIKLSLIEYWQSCYFILLM